jgi:hypothetical protein
MGLVSSLKSRRKLALEILPRDSNWPSINAAIPDPTFNRQIACFRPGWQRSERAGGHLFWSYLKLLSDGIGKDSNSFGASSRSSALLAVQPQTNGPFQRQEQSNSYCRELCAARQSFLAGSNMAESSATFPCGIQDQSWSLSAILKKQE